MISVVVVDDHPLVREHVAQAIVDDERLELVGQAGDGEEALCLAQKHHPDALILDVEMPKLDGAEVLRALRARETASRVLVLTGHARPGPLHEVLHHRPDSLLRKGASTEEICDEIVAMKHDERSPGRANVESAQVLAYTRVELNPTERNVLRLCAQGVSVNTLAVHLQVSASAAKGYRHDLCEKLDVSTIPGAVAKALQIGLLE